MGNKGPKKPNYERIIIDLYGFYKIKKTIIKAILPIA